MTNPAIINPPFVSPSLQSNSQASLAVNKFLSTRNHLPSVLQFFSAKDLAILERVNRIFREETLTAIEMQMRHRNVISFTELYQFTQFKLRGKLVDSLLPLSPCLNQLTEIDFSHWDFDDLDYELLKTLPYEHLQKVISLNFSSTSSLSTNKLKSLFLGIPVFFNADPKQALPPAFLFSNLRSLNFADSTFNDAPKDLSINGIFLESGYGVC